MRGINGLSDPIGGGEMREVEEEKGSREDH